MANQPNLKHNLKYVPTPINGLFHVGASDALYTQGCDIYVWENKSKPQFVGVHAPCIRNKRDRTGLVKLAELISHANRMGYAVSYEPPRSAAKSGGIKYRPLDLEEMTELRKTQGLPPLSLAA